MASLSESVMEWPGSVKKFFSNASNLHKALEERISLRATLIQPRLHHYTTVEGLKGIVQEDTLWATSAAFLNDSSELTYGVRILRSVLKEWLDANENTTTSSSSIGLRVLQQFNTHFESEFARPEGVFVACFCEEGNLLSQWRAYGQKGGYSIDFGETWRITKQVVPQVAHYDAELKAVQYEEANQRKRCNRLLRAYLDGLGDHALEADVRELSEERRREFEIIAMVVMNELFLDEVAAFKNPAFREEKEWRLIVRPRILKPVIRSSRADLPILHFRTSRGTLIPYLKLIPADKGKLPMAAVRFGPSLDKDGAKNSLQMFLASHGYGSVRIVGADIPVLL